MLVWSKVLITMLESTLSAFSSLIGTLLLMSGDVELNPGPGIKWLCNIITTQCMGSSINIFVTFIAFKMSGTSLKD